MHAGEAPQEQAAAAKAFDKVVAYCTLEACRRAFVLQYFGETLSAGACNKGCDWCRHPDVVQQQVGLTTCVFVNALTVTLLALSRHRHLEAVIRASDTSCMSHSWQPWRLMPWQRHRPAALGLVEVNQHVGERVTPFLGRRRMPQRGVVLKASIPVSLTMLGHRYRMVWTLHIDAEVRASAHARTPSGCL